MLNGVSAELLLRARGNCVQYVQHADVRDHLVMHICMAFSTDNASTPKYRNSTKLPPTLTLVSWMQGVGGLRLHSPGASDMSKDGEPDGLLRLTRQASRAGQSFKKMNFAKNRTSTSAEAYFHHITKVGGDTLQYCSTAHMLF